MVDIKVFKENEKLNEAYKEMLGAVNDIGQKYQLSYFELWGILKAIDTDYTLSNMEED